MKEALASRIDFHHDEPGMLPGYLLSQYGPLMTMDDLAVVLRRNRKALRESIQANPDAEWVKAIMSARITVGARYMFRTHQIAEFLLSDGRHEC